MKGSWPRPRQQARIALGMCPDCGEKESAPGGLRCALCRKTKNQQHRQRYSEHRDAGLLRYTPEKYSALAAKRRAERAARKAAGLCIGCGRESKKFVLCNVCRTKCSEHKRTYRRRSKELAEGRRKYEAKTPRFRAGWCHRCTKNDSEPGRAYCTRCLCYMKKYDDARSQSRKEAYRARRRA
jgi:hypothetical protein